jgi:hypothetical protein
MINCLNLIKNNQTNDEYCIFLSNRLGVEYKTCDKLCESCKINGPYNNKQISKEEEKKFVINSIKEFNKDLLKLLYSTLEDYELIYDIEIPLFYKKLKEKLFFLKDCKGFEKFTLTGPCITQQKSEKSNNIDIILWFDSMENWILNKKFIIDKMPSGIEDFTLNFYFYTGNEKETSNLIFFQLDVENKIIYTSKWFESKLRKVPENFKIRFSPYEYYDYELKHGSGLEEFKKHKPIESQLDSNVSPIKQKWAKAVDSWRKASNFINAANSRGIISTAMDFIDINNSGGNRVSDEIYNLRRESCFGNEQLDKKPCEFLKRDFDNEFFCGACGCGSNKLAVLNSKEPGGYSKLHYPHLECPLKKPGFSNHNQSIE